MNITDEFFDKYYLKSFNPEIDANPTPEEVGFIISKTNISKKMKILDFACGQGRHTIEFYKRGFTKITGIDQNQTNIEIAKNILKEGYTIESISKITNLPENKIKKMKID